MEIHSAFFVPQAATAANFCKTKKRSKKITFFLPCANDSMQSKSY